MKSVVQHTLDTKRPSMKILVAVGGSPNSDKALQFTVELARQTESSVTIVTVVKKMHQQMQGERVLAHALTTVLPYLDQCQTRLRVGYPVEEIVREAKQGTYHLIVVGEPQHHGIVTRFVLESTFEQIVAHAPCPVLIVKGSRVGRLRRLLLCDSGIIDPTLLSRLIQQLPRLLDQGEEITILHVMSQIGAAPGIPDKHLRASAEDLILAQTPEGELLERDLAILQKHDIVCRPKIRHGLVVDEIVSEVHTGEYDLVVIGAHGDQIWQRLLLDNLSQQIITHVDRSILVVR